ncbi:amino acid racemase [Egibacter rhizosphaerae]|uniref:Amino acid racemase n=1 Tax=Egibacter rhizosphaerae TaxID=1670831 RepID=A0A411YGZ1_9ACTN|nr:amino acid racemase [Egibacter rhizosphaerae]QBI20508.1 amino acid racemase [Egibacter rhizosphaerae]
MTAAHDERVIGVLGGMGPMATLELYRRLIDAVPAARDQGHPRVIIDSNAKVPDRTEALLHDGADPLPFLLDSARTLERAGADLLIMPCNTAHVYAEEIASAAGLPLVHMLQETAAIVPAEHAPVGVLATSATTALGLYQQAFARHGLGALTPEPHAQELAMTAIERVKAGDLASALPPAREAAEHLVARGAASLVLGCTEFSVLLAGSDTDDTHDLGVPTIDPLDALAVAALDRAGVVHRASPDRAPPARDPARPPAAGKGRP